MRSPRLCLALAAAIVLLCALPSARATNVTPSLPVLALPLYDYHFEMQNPPGPPLLFDGGVVRGAFTAPVASSLTLPNTRTSSTQTESAGFNYQTVANGTDGLLSLDMTNPATVYSSGIASADLFYQFEVVGTPATQVPVDIDFGDVKVQSVGGVDVTAAATLYSSTLNPQSNGFFSAYDTQLVCGHAGPGYGGVDEIATLDDCRDNANSSQGTDSIVGAGPLCSDNVSACQGGTTNGIPEATPPNCTQASLGGTDLESGTTNLNVANFSVQCDLTAGEIYTLGLNAAMTGPFYETPGSSGAVLIDPVITLGPGVDPTVYSLDSAPAPAPEPASLPVIGLALALFVVARPLARGLHAGAARRMALSWNHRS